MTVTPPSIYPTIRYDDAPAAIRFLTTAFGLVAQEVDEGSDRSVNHALLRHGPSLVMISSRRPGRSIFDQGDLLPLPDQPYGSREYAARDPEGNIWAFGTYRPAAMITDSDPQQSGEE